MESADTANPSAPESQQVFKQVQQLLSTIPHTLLSHPPAKTSQQSSKFRNTPLQWGAKTMIVKKSTTNEYVMLIYPANKKLSWSKVKKCELVGKKFEKADQQIEEIIKVKQGGIPPFPFLFNMKGVMDERVTKKESVAFNAGMTTRSVVMRGKDLPTGDCVLADICEGDAEG